VPAAAAALPDTASVLDEVNTQKSTILDLHAKLLMAENKNQEFAEGGRSKRSRHNQPLMLPP
jgi:hypothetical protein